MSPEEENNLILLLCKYGKENKAFKLPEFYSTIKDLTNADRKFVEEVLLDWGDSPDPNHIITFNSFMNNIQKNPKERIGFILEYDVRLLPNALFSYIDHLEIVEARKAALIAKQQSRTAIIISVFALIASTVLGIIQICLTK